MNEVKNWGNKIFHKKSRDWKLITMNRDLTSSLTTQLFAGNWVEKKVIDQYVVGSFCI